MPSLITFLLFVTIVGCSSEKFFVILCSIRPVSHRTVIGRNYGAFPKLFPSRFPHKKLSILLAADDMNWDPKSAPKLDFNEDYYSVLEVDPAINAKDLKKAYYKIVFKYHPDNKETDTAKSLANKQMMVINAAYKVLKDPDARAAYDRKRKYSTFGSSSGSKSQQTSTSTKPPSSSTYSRTYSSSTTTQNASVGEGTGSGADSFFDSYFNRSDRYEAVESLQDIFADLWGEMRRAGPAVIVDDFLSFLEDQVSPAVSSTAWRNVDFSSSPRSTARSRAEIQSEISILRAAVDNLQRHLGEMRQARSETSVDIMNDKARQTQSNTPETLEDMERRLSKIESLKGLEGRIAVVEKQLRDLQKQLRTSLKDLESSQDSSNKTNSSSSARRDDSTAWKAPTTSGKFNDWVGSTTARPTTNANGFMPPRPSVNSERSSRQSNSDFPRGEQTKEQKVEEELQMLKKKLGK